MPSRKASLRGRLGVSRRTLLRGAVTGAAAVAVTPLAAQHEVRPVHDYSKGLYLVISGSGSALVDPFRGNAGQAVVVDGSVIQFDCGRKTMDNLMLAGINPVEVDYIFFTHLHFDHIATYDYYVISSWIAGRNRPFQVFGPEGTESMSRGAFEGMHALDVKFVEKLVENWVSPTPEKPLPKLPVTVKDIGPGTVLETEKFKISAAYTPHLAAWQMRSLGYRIDTSYGAIAISGDTAPSQAMLDLGKGVDVLVHECVVPDTGMTRDGKFTMRQGIRRLETDTENPGTGHTSPSEPGRLAQSAGVKTLVATHLPPLQQRPCFDRHVPDLLRLPARARDLGGVDQRHQEGIPRTCRAGRGCDGDQGWLGRAPSKTVLPGDFLAIGDRRTGTGGERQLPFRQVPAFARAILPLPPIRSGPAMSLNSSATGSRKLP